MESSPTEHAREVARFVREEFERLASLGVNWKITLNGSADGEVRCVVETHQSIISRHEVVTDRK